MNKCTMVMLAALAGCASVPETPVAVVPPVKINDYGPAKLVHAGNVPFEIGIARYTMWNTPFDRALDIIQAIGCNYMSLIEGTISKDATSAEIAAYKENLAKRGITVDTLGPCYFDNEAAIEKEFVFAKRYGMKMISVVPLEKKLVDGKQVNFESEAMLDVLEKMVKKYDIRAAIHNHGPETPHLFPTAESVWKRIEKRDPRIGFCFDVGHQARFGGGDPVKFIREHADRMYDIHLKNIRIDPVKNLAMPGPRGELDIPAILQALAEIGFDGVCHIEYERDHGDNLVPLAESVGYYRGVMDTLKFNPKMAPAPKDANTLSGQEQADGWELLWNGKDLNGWVGVKNEFKTAPEKGWVIADGTLTMKPMNGITDDGGWFPLPPEDQKLAGGGDIVTVKKYRDFAFKFDFRLTRKANSGVKYFYDEKQNGGSCEEYQILESGHPDSDKGKDGNRKSASLYDIYSAHADELLAPVGKWNTGMIVAKGSKVEHWLNGKKVLEYTRGTKEFKAAVNASKYAKWGKTVDGQPQDWGEIAEGRILLQDHTDSTVSFCNLKLKVLR